jgi:lipopolysaccharide transport system ATP-binding protein
VAILEFENVRKAYRLHGRGSLRDAIPEMLGRVVGRDGRGGKGLLWALDGVSFEVEKGETLGLIGSNGAGKTTILKLLARVTRPTSGYIAVKGRVSALIELGAGFHPDLTGRENVYLNAAILGLRRKEIEERFDSIVEFAELGQFIDMPVKRYSSGMYVRLGFSVAIHADPEVLLVDEVLAVGDMAFQRKCLDRIGVIRSKGSTIVFVTHNMRTVQSLCNRVLWLEKGRIRQIGDAQSIVAGYTDEMNRLIASMGLRQYGGNERRGSGEVQFTSIRLLNGDGRETNTFQMGDKLVIEMGYQAHRRVLGPSFDVAIYAHNGTRVCTATSRLSSCAPECLAGEGVARCVFDSIPFTPGGYAVTVALFDQDDLTKYDQWYNAVSFTVGSELIGDARWHLTQGKHGVVYLPSAWEY